MMLLMDKAVKECLEEYWSCFIKTESVCSFSWSCFAVKGSSDIIFMPILLISCIRGLVFLKWGFGLVCGLVLQMKLVMGWLSSIYDDYFADMECLKEHGGDSIMTGSSYDKRLKERISLDTVRIGSKNKVGCTLPFLKTKHILKIRDILKPHRPSGSTTLISPCQGDPIEMMASIGKDLFDFRRGVVEDMGQGSVSGASFDGRIKSVDCKFLKVANPWFSCENNGSSAREGGPSPEWTRLFWKSFSSLADLPLFSGWSLALLFLAHANLDLALETAYNNSSVERIHSLRDSLHNLSKGTSTVSDYGHQFKGICDKLAAIGHLWDSNPQLKYSMDGAMHNVMEALKNNNWYNTLVSFWATTFQTLFLGYSDADWARCIETRRSTYGYSIFLGGNLVSWCAKKQPTVSRSSCESEYHAMANTAAEIIWITDLLRELHALPPD
ncbi:uncharacterized mitochondrial protein-like protein [Tanacetum coccineum]